MGKEYINAQKTQLKCNCFYLEVILQIHTGEIGKDLYIKRDNIRS